MHRSDQNSLMKLNIMLDKMLDSEAFRQQMAESDADILRVASLLIDAPHPQITPSARQTIRQQMMRALVELETQPFQQEISPYEKQTEDLSRSQVAQDMARATDDDHQNVASLLAFSPLPTLSDDKRNHIFDKLVQQAEALSLIPRDSAPQQVEPRLSDEGRLRIYARMLEAQRQLQLDALINSDEALAIASDNPDPLIQSALMLKRAPVPMLSPQGRVRVRERILPPMSVQPVPEPIAPADPMRRVLRPNFSATIQRIVASVLIVMFISLLVAPSASAGSLPGDLLYPVKRGLEQVSLQLTTSDRGRARQHLDHAQERLVEMNNLYARGLYDTRLLDDALTSVENATRIARNAQFLEADPVFQDTVVTVLTALDEVIVRYDQAPVLVETLDTLQARQQQEVNAVRPQPTLTPLPEIVQEPASTEVLQPERTPFLIEPTSTPEVTEPAPELVEVTEEPALLTETVTLYTSASGAVRVRIAPDLNARVLTTLTHGASVTQIGTNADQTWVQVRLSDGREGWIASFLLVGQPPTMPDTAGNSGNNSNASGNANGNASDANANSNANNATGNAGNNNNASGNANGNAGNNNNASGNANGNAGNNNNASGNATGNAGNNNNASGNATGNAGNNNNASGNANGNAGNNP
ncbi:MAG: DUF5667 domain-containing protein [Anaerolineae bacterium]